MNNFNLRYIVVITFLLGLVVGLFSNYKLFNLLGNVNNGITVLCEDDLSFLENLDEILLVDCRESLVYNIKHVKDSVNVRLCDVESNPVAIRNLIIASGKKKVVLFCSGNQCDTASRIAPYLAFMNLDIRIYTGGWHIIKNVATLES
jgi:rhodanese-related sulfurtransferase